MVAGAQDLLGGDSGEHRAIHVLHVDDDGDFVEMVAARLQRENDEFVVHTAQRAADGLDLLDEEPIDCVVSDFDMPLMDGLEFLDAVRERFPDLPFVLFTGKGSEQIAAEAISAGVTDYFQKTADAEKYALLANRIEHAVEQRRARRTVERTREWFQTLTDRASDLITVVDAEMTVRYQSASIEEVLGYEADDVLGESVTTLLHPDDADDVARRFRRVVDDPDTAEATVATRIRSRAGEWRWFEAVISDRTDTFVDGYVVNSRDVTDRVERERNLRRINDLMERTQRLADVGGWEYDVRTEEAWWTPQAGQIHGLDGTSGEYVYERAIEQYHPEDRPTIRAAFERAITEGVPFDLELRIGGEDDDVGRDGADANSDGSENHDEAVRWVRTRGEPQYEDGELARVRGVVHDVTERKRREERLRQEHDRFTTLFENLPNPVVHTVIEDGTPTVRRVNRRFRETFGSAEVHEQEFSAALDTDVVDGSDGDGDAEADAAAEATRSGQTSGVVRRETTDGPRDFRVDVVVDGFDGEAPDGYAIYTDVTERLDRERELEIYETVLESLDDAVYALDDDGRLVFVNDSYVSMKGVSRSALLGTHISEWVDPEVVERSGRLVEEMRRGDRDAGTLEYDLRTDTEETVPVELRFVTISLPGGGEGRAGVIRDVSDRVERERQLRQKTERLERFASVVSHDLRNPLNVALGRIELAQETGDTDHLDHARDSLDSIATLVEDLLALASADRTDAPTEPVDLGTLAAECWQDVETAQASLDVTIDARVEANETRVRQLFANLFGNAVDHAGPEAAVTVGRLDDGFYVADDGPGVTDDDRVFEPGYSTASDGVGFGLSIVQEVATDHGWDVVVDTDADGARFGFRNVEWL